MFLHRKLTFTARPTPGTQQSELYVVDAENRLVRAAMVSVGICLNCRGYQACHPVNVYSGKPEDSCPYYLTPNCLACVNHTTERNFNYLFPVISPY